ncbi:MAG TPA: hypothetical protein VIF08_01285 [Candidatus Limnocylindrales bacterium]|jgi:hypothetical protein
MRYSELVIAAAIIALTTVGYATYVSTSGVPPAGDLVGHLLGIIGFTLMLLTETLYSLRKRALGRARGSMRTWLRAHIVMGIVGPYLVLLHTAWEFNGLAGLLTLMTAIVVISGFIGRYIYAAVPRTADGAVLEAQELNETLASLRLAEAARPGAMDEAARRARREIERRIRTLERQISALRWERRALATWHTIHIPLGMTMFVVAFAHIAAALYYGTLMR